MNQKRRGLILPVILFILLMVGILGAMFAFRVYADVSSVRAVAYRLQTRLAAEAGVERVKLLLRYGRFDQGLWYHNPDELHRVIVWADGMLPEVSGTTEEFDGRGTVYRFSIVADDPSNDEEFIRLGITDEASKLDLNLATVEQLLPLVREAVGEREDVIPEDIVDAIVDWRDEDSNPNGEAADTEGEYYRSLDYPYLIKNAPYDSVEELLLVKGLTGQILYGEDQDRTGLLTPNEKDGDESFPPDNQDEFLNRGLYPYLTVMAYENNVDNGNHPRINLLGDAEKLRAELELVFEGRTEVIDFIVNATRAPNPPGPNGNQPNGGQPNANQPGGNQPNGNRGNGNQNPKPRNKPPNNTGQQGSQDNTDNPIGDVDENPYDDKPPPEKGVQSPPDGQDNDDNADTTGDTQNPPDGNPPNGNPPAQDGSEDDQPDDGADSKGDQETDGAGNQPRPIRSPASLMFDRALSGNQPGTTPLTLEDLPILMDRFTVIPPEERKIKGLINVNTAPRLVLESLPGLTTEQVDAILEIRETLSPAAKATTAWLAVTSAVDLETFDQIAPLITARGQQFTIESLGYADHIGMVTRLQVVVDMVGPMAQTIYYRDISQLGANFPIREEDLERIRAR